MLQCRHWIAGFLLLPALSFGQAPAPQAAQTLKDAAQKAVIGNPEVQQRWHAYLAADGERDAAFGNYLPHLDLTAGRGRESRDTPTTTGNYTLNSRSLTLTQMLYDGFATRNEVKRLDHARRVRMFELWDASESAALEASRAYLDVMRYRKLLTLAEENYVRHRSVFDQIQQKVQAGVGRRVDLEQAAGRLALAESNLLTETSNLHDVSARFQRIVGDAPTKQLEEPTPLTQGIPADMPTAQKIAQAGNPALQAAIENVRSADAAQDSRKAAYQPRLDLRLKRDQADNLSGVTGRTSVGSAEVILSWNLFNGLSDQARARQYAEQTNVAKDVRDKTCRDIRQTLAIAYNDVRKLGEQITYLDQHQLSTEKARDAYRKQFDIGQRTLLDLLDTENELFQARRAYHNAEWDLAIAQVRTQAGMGKLLTALGLARAPEQVLPELANWGAAEEAAERCPAEGPQLYIADKAALDARAQEMLREAAAAAKAAMAAPSGPTPSIPRDTAAARARAAAPATAIAATPAAAAASTERALGEALKHWMAAWSAREIEAYLAAYAPDFTPADGSARAAWAHKRRAVLARASAIELDVAEVQIAVSGDQAETRFKQTYRAPNHNDIVMKTLAWRRVDGKWLIVAESAEPLPR